MYWQINTTYDWFNHQWGSGSPLHCYLLIKARNNSSMLHTSMCIASPCNYMHLHTCKHTHTHTTLHIRIHNKVTMYYKYIVSYIILQWTSSSHMVQCMYVHNHVQSGSYVSDQMGESGWLSVGHAAYEEDIKSHCDTVSYLTAMQLCNDIRVCLHVHYWGTGPFRQQEYINSQIQRVNTPKHCQQYFLAITSQVHTVSQHKTFTHTHFISSN